MVNHGVNRLATWITPIYLYDVPCLDKKCNSWLTSTASRKPKKSVVVASTNK